MRKAALIFSAGLAIAASGAARADSYYDVEHARANARAGGPVSYHDAELLERYGTTSGTPEWRHRVRDSYYFRDDRPVRRKLRRHHHRHD